MAYSTPTYDFGRQTNDLTTTKGLQDNAQEFGRFLSQERFRRGQSEANRVFQERFPKIGSSFNSRGLYHSGLRREGQRKEAEAFQRGTDNARFEQGAAETQMDMQQTMRDQQYQLALQSLVEQLQKARATTFDPFASIGGVIGNG